MQPNQEAQEHREIAGVLRNWKSKSADCICCDGPHIDAWGIEIEHKPSSIYPGTTVDSIDRWIDEELAPWRDRPGMKVRVTLDFNHD